MHIQWRTRTHYLSFYRGLPQSIQYINIVRSQFHRHVFKKNNGKHIGCAKYSRICVQYKEVCITWLLFGAERDAIATRRDLATTMCRAGATNIWILHQRTHFMSPGLKLSKNIQQIY